MTVLTFSQINESTFRLSHDHGDLAQVRFSVYQDANDLFAKAKVESELAEYNFGTWLIKSKMMAGLELSMVVARPDFHYLVFDLQLINRSGRSIHLDHLIAPQIKLNTETFPSASELWTMQGAAVGWGQDFAFELPVDFSRENYLGHLQDAEGGGIPVNYIWNQNLGLALLHLEEVPQEWYLPVSRDQSLLLTSFEYRKPLDLKAGETVNLPRVAISIHRGDFFEPLDLYRKLMAHRGQIPAVPSPACFEPAWCSWGYEFDITSSQMLGVIPALKELNIRWMTLDDRWFDAYGDWNPRPDTFPGGESEMRQMNDRIHAEGCFNQIWWYPLCAEDGKGEWESHYYGVSQILKEHPDWVVLDENDKVARNNRHLAMLCPALPEVQEYTRGLVETFIRDWGFDGHKLDNIYTMPACHNPAHHHTQPEESIEAFGKVYKMIFDLTRQIKPNSVTQICSCGTPITHSLLPAVDQTVTADPTSSAQIRQRIKFYKALMGSQAAVFADHVELTDGSRDFASEIGTGGVPATKFIYPDEMELKAKLNEYWNFPPEKQAEWKRWFDLYNQYRLAEGEYLNLYDLAFDSPEAHVIRKDGCLFYAFYSEEFDGVLELRGLPAGNFKVIDYISNRMIGNVSAAHPEIKHSFHGAALLKASPRS